jgi:hypothetical protein
VLSCSRAVHPGSSRVTTTLRFPTTKQLWPLPLTLECSDHPLHVRWLFHNVELA